MSSINTKNSYRDTHLKSDDFFYSVKFPKIKFIPKSFNRELLIGDITIKYLTNEIILDADFNGIAVEFMENKSRF
ncbi:YceI family protein [Tenacibaculum soleae]|uniref:YceI family protein n=1 Tax=Tenacibaculum soleae TaxID=447689 RepID=UPI003AB3B945